ncbi:hypothetical protein EST38_g3759 [Candolleomyces aberdarensis]|uniref:F-box domain-containing protein n=1 Tax=Candolleomyces aberdarensis TaxID=2316362 RepID=A0A4Q2DPK1_9AGAR|nr:hypothetical protein EST38_g3759 [Candolleomyces aberdarensis]
MAGAFLSNLTSGDSNAAAGLFRALWPKVFQSTFLILTSSSTDGGPDSKTEIRGSFLACFEAAMSTVYEHDTAASSSTFEQIPAELWSKILHEEQGFTVEDFKILCFVTPLFKTICQPLVYRSLTIRGVRECGGYVLDPGWEKQDVTISIGATPNNTISPPSMLQPPTDNTMFSKAAYGAFSQFKAALVRTLPLFTHLRRLELGLFPIDDGLLRAIASHPVLHELKLEACSFSSPTFPIPCIRLLECDMISQEQAPAAFRLACSQHLEGLQIKNMEASVALQGLRARLEDESTLKKLQRLTIIAGVARLSFLDVESLLNYMPALRQLDIVNNQPEAGAPSFTLSDGNQTIKPSAVPHLRRVSGSLSFARYVAPGRPVSDIRSGGGNFGYFAKTWAELEALLYPLCLSTATAEGITTLRLPKNHVAPIWLLSRFVAQTFPRLVDLRLPVGMISDEEELLNNMFLLPRRRGGRTRKLLNAEGSFDDGVAEKVMDDIRADVEYELVGGFDDPDNRTTGLDYETRSVSSPPLTISTPVSSPGVDVAATFATLCANIKLDSTGRPSQDPEDYREALIYFAQGLYPLPTGIQTLSFKPGSFPDYRMPFNPSRAVDQETCIAIVAALGERYPSLSAVTLIGRDGYRCERVRELGNVPGNSITASFHIVIPTRISIEHPRSAPALDFRNKFDSQNIYPPTSVTEGSTAQEDSRCTNFELSLCVRFPLTENSISLPSFFCAAMSAIRESEKGDFASILERIPVELWNRILNEEQGFTAQDFKTLCFVAPLFRTICQPAAFRCLATSFVLSYGYCFRDERRTEATICPRVVDCRRQDRAVELWRRDMVSLIRAERRLSLVGGHPALSTFPQTISISARKTSMASSMAPRATIDPPMHQPPADEMVLSWAAYDVVLQLKGTLARTLPLFTHLRRLEFRLLPIDDGLLRAIASHPVLNELKLEACSFPSPTFPLPRIRLLEYDEISQEQAPAAFRLASSQHLEELQIDNMGTPAVLEGLRARPETESMLKKLRRLTMKPSAQPKLLDMEKLLGYVPALHQLDIRAISIQEGNQAMDLSTIPHLRRFYGPLSLAQYVVPGRPVSDIRSVGYHRYFMETWPELQAHLYPLCLSTATAEGIETLHLPYSNVAPIWLLSQFVAEKFPRLVDLKLLVGTIRDMGSDLCDIGWAPISFDTLPGNLLVVKESFEDGVVEGMVKLIKDKVEHELVTSFDNPSHQAMDLDNQTRRGTSRSPPIQTFVPLPEVDVVKTLAGQSSHIELDSTGQPLNHPKNYEEALIYFAQGWYPIPTNIQTLSIRPGTFLGDDSGPVWPSGSVQQETCIAILTALGERYPSLAVVMLNHSDVYRCERIRGVGNGTMRWTVLATPKR